MRVFVAGATGVIGAELVPLLVDAGHEVVGMARSDSGRAQLDEAGARPVQADLFDPDLLRSAVSGSDAIINLATAIPPVSKMANRRAWRDNDRLRSEGVANVVDASIDAGVSRFVQPSITFMYADGSDSWLDETSPIDPPAGATESALEAEAATARFTREGGSGVILRLSRLYGPGRASAELVEMLRKGRGIVVGDGSNYVSSLHVSDAATAHLAALDIPAGIYNVTDDEPLTSLDLMTAQALAVGGSPPRRLPTWIGRLALRDAFGILTVSQRVSNARFREVSGWRPSFPDAATGATSLQGSSGP